MGEDAQVASDLWEACLLWDIDGTLVLNAPAARDRHCHAVRVALDLDATPVPLGTGKTDRQLIAEIISAHLEPSDVAVDAALAALDEVTAQDLEMFPSSAVPGVAEVLDALAPTPIRQRLLTGNTPRRAELKVGTAGLGQYFGYRDGFYGDRHATRYDLVGQAAVELGEASIPRTVIVGDTPLDIAAARSAGFPVISVATGSISAADLAAHEPDALLDDFSGGPEAFMAALRKALQASPPPP